MLLRYFQCMPRYGLFAPVHKVTRIGFPCTTPTKTKSAQRRSLLKRSPSASSMSSLSSANSSFSGKPSRAGLVSLGYFLVVFRVGGRFRQFQETLSTSLPSWRRRRPATPARSPAPRRCRRP